MRNEGFRSLKLVIVCTLLGLLFGAIGGGLSAILFGDPMAGVIYGSILGPIYGFVNGIVLAVVDRRPGIRYDTRDTYARLAKCCVGVSVELNTGVIALALCCVPVVAIACLFGYPAVIIAAFALAGFVTSSYPENNIG